MACYAVQHWGEYVHHSFQIEIANAVRKLGRVPDHRIVGLALQQKLSRDSDLIANGHLDGIQKRGFNLEDIEYHLLCKEQHYSGCVFVLKQALAARGVTNPSINRVPVDVPFDNESSQFYTRGPIRVFFYKIFRIADSIFKGHIKLKDLINFALKR